jgi:uncharacterized protein (TIGR03083 family)
MAATDHEATYEVATATRLLAAEMFAGLTEEQWRSPSLCAGWTSREVAAHLAEPLETGMSLASLVVALVRARGSLDRMVDVSATRYAARPTAELVATLRGRADVRLSPPIIGPRGPMCDSLIHLRDVARPLGLDANPPPEHWRHVLDFVTDPKGATTGFVGRGHLRSLRLVATDQDWTHGDGAELHGPSEALVMALTGRSVALADLDGPGVEVLRGRLR